MTSQSKVLEVERQVRALVAGEQAAEFQCPFCGLGTKFSDWTQNVLCCNEASEVIGAVLDHIDHIERCEVVNKSMDRLASLQAKALLN